MRVGVVLADAIRRDPLWMTLFEGEVCAIHDKVVGALPGVSRAYPSFKAQPIVTYLARRL